jgi:hypothetical protein
MGIRDDLRGTPVQGGETTGATPEEGSWWTDFIVAALIAIGFMVVHIAIPGDVPSGADPGGWLAMAKERFGDEVLAARDATYLPGFPLLLGTLLTFVDPINAITAAGVISKVALVLAIYLVVLPVGRGYAAAAAVMVGIAGAHGEMYAWGGFPQQLGTAMGLIAVFYLVRYLESRSVRLLVLSAVAAASTLFTHNLVGGLLAGALFVAAAHWLYLTGASRREWISGIGHAAILAVPASLTVALYLLIGQAEGRQPSINPNELTWGQSVMHIVGEAPIPWLILTALALTLSMSRRWSGPNAATVAVGGSWLVTSLILFLAIGEPRALLLTQMGLVMIAVPGYAELLRVAGDRNVYARDALAVLGAILLVAVAASGYTDYDAATDYYRVVDDAEIAALDQLAEISRPGDLVVASVGQHGVQVGWWVQGYAERPTYPGGSITFLASPQERAQGATANTVFEAGSDSASLLDQIGARFVVVDRRGQGAAWLESEFARSLKTIDASSSLVILKLPEKG